MIIIYVTHKDEKHAKRMIDSLLKRKLVKCATMFPVKSFYEWKGERKATKEVTVLFKTAQPWKTVRTAIEKSHEYDVPCIIKINATASRGFDAWLRA